MLAKLAARCDPLTAVFSGWNDPLFELVVGLAESLANKISNRPCAPQQIISDRGIQKGLRTSKDPWSFKLIYK
jgi:hypothetical protein